MPDSSSSPPVCGSSTSARNLLEGDPNAFSPRPTFDAASEVSANPKLSLGYFLQPAAARSRSWTRLRFSAGTGIRPPDAFEIAFTDNPTLKPERSRSVDFGVEQALAGGAVAVEATAFLNRYDDLIVAVGQSLQNASQFRTDNIANSQARGVENRHPRAHGVGFRRPADLYPARDEDPRRGPHR